jgi:hypothetical protein
MCIQTPNIRNLFIFKVQSWIYARNGKYLGREKLQPVAWSYIVQCY